MKPFRLISLLLLIALVWWGAREKIAVNRLQIEHETLVKRAVAISLPEREFDDASELSRITKRAALAGKIPAADLKNELVSAYLRLKGLNAETDPESRMKVEEEVREWIGRLIDLSPKELKQVVNDLLADSALAKEDRTTLLSVVLSLASSRQSETAAELALAHRESGGDIRGIIHNWAGQEPAGAFAWLEKNKETLGKDYAKAWEEAVKQSAGRDPALALQELAKIHTSRREEVSRGMAENLHDDASRAAFVAELRQDKFSGLANLLLSSLGQSLAKRSPDEVRDTIKSLNMDEAAVISNAVLSSGEGLDHAEAWLDWSKGLQVPAFAPSSVPPLLTKWISDDYEAAGDWINKQPPGDLKNQAVTEYARQMSKRFPGTARDWANTLPEGPKKRWMLDYLKSLSR